MLAGEEVKDKRARGRGRGRKGKNAFEEGEWEGIPVCFLGLELRREGSADPTLGGCGRLRATLLRVK